jgi:transposase
MGERRERDQKKAPRANPASTDTDAEALRRRVEELETENDRLRRENEILREKVEVLNREAHRQAAPFRRPEQKRTTAPKRPGRPKGHVGSHRPRPARVDETIEAPLSQCACCGGAVTDVEPIEQFIEDIPEVRPRVTRIVTYTGRCSRCGVTASTHPRQMSHAVGAAGTQVGPRTLALAVDLNKRLGVPFRKTCDVLQEHLGIRVTPGALVQAEARLADRVRVRYENLRMQLRRSRSVYSDETSWYVGAPNHWLWVFTSNDTTLYVVDKRRGTDVVLEVLGKTFSGVLSSDCLNIYDSLPYVQNKCYAHHLKAISKALEMTPKGESTRLIDIKNLLLTAIALGKIRRDIPLGDYRRFVASLERRADEILSADVVDLFASKVVNRLRKQRDHLFTFLHVENVDPTNNAAERALRPAVISRKVSCGNRTDRGRRTWQTLVSLAATHRQRGRSFARFVERALPINLPVPRLPRPTGPP